MSLKAMTYEELPMKVSSPRKIVKDNKTKQLQGISMGEFLWVKVRQHRNGLILFAFVAENAWFVYHFVMYGV